MAEDDTGVTEQVFEPSPTRAQTPFGEHYPWIFTFFGEDVLEVTSWNSAPGVRLRISGRVHAAPGVIVPFSATHTPNTDRTPAMSVITMPLGELLNAIVWAEAGSPQSGQTFVRVSVRRGAGAAFERLGILMQGSVTANTARAFPGSPVQSALEGEPYVRAIVGTRPAAGVQVLEVVPTGARWELVVFYVSLDVAAAGLNRSVFLNITSAGSTLGVFGFGLNVPPPAAPQYCWGEGLDPVADANNRVYEGPLPARTLLVGGATIATAVYNFDVADRFGTPQYTVREWLDI